MKLNILKYSIATVLAFGIVSCSSDDDNGYIDNEKPTITINKPADGKHLHPGETIDVDVDLADNVGLSTYKIDIHYAGDGHQHKSAEAEEGWSQTITGNIENGAKTYKISRTIDIPSDFNYSSGDYHFGIYAIDQAGNETIKYIEIEIADHGHDH